MIWSSIALKHSVLEELGHTDEHVVEDRRILGRGLLQIVNISGHGIDLVDGHASFDAAENGAGLIQGKIVAGLGIQKDKYLFQGGLGFGRGRGKGQRGSAEGP